MRAFFKFLTIAVFSFFSCSVASAQSADAIMKMAADMINGAKGISARFTIETGGKTIAGSMKASGKKFSIQTPASCTWYDGSTMWTYNANIKETTVIIPTLTEVSEANPLSLVNTYTSSFTASFAKGQKKGSKTIVLTPKSKKLGYKSVHVTIPDNSPVPSRLVVIPASGQKITLNIKEVSCSQTIPASSFVYPKAKYPKVEIVDLR